MRREDRQSRSGGNGRFKLVCIAQSPNQSMMRFDVRGVGSDCFAKRLCCSRSIAGSKQIHASL